MSEHDNELLSQYLDGELGSPETLALKQRLLAEPDLRAALTQMQQVDNALRNAFDRPQASQVPSQISAMVSNNTAHGQPQRQAAWGLAIAASVLAASGLLFKSTQFADVDANTDTHFVHVLEHQPSRSSGWNTLPDGRQMRALLSFNSESHGWCREYLLTDTEQQSHGIACRGNGEWINVAISPQTRGTLLDNSAGDYRPAGANNPDVIQQFVDSHGSDIPLSAAAEAQLLATGWR